MKKSTSPVYEKLKQIIIIDARLVQPIYIQIAQQIINAIQRGYIIKGSKLPGTRVLSALLGIHRNTAVAVYDELASQGWVSIEANKGTFVLYSDLNKTTLKAINQSQHQAYTYNTPATTAFSFQSKFHLASVLQHSTARYIVNDGQEDLRQHPAHQFSRWYTAALKRKGAAQKWRRGYNIELQLQLCNYLNATRGFYVSPKHVLSTRSSSMSLYIVAQLLITPGDLVLVGQWSNHASNSIFQQAGARLQTIPVDYHGLDIEAIKAIVVNTPIRCVYVNSNRHYPTTATLSVKRRMALLQLAATYKFAIIEDHFDYDFQLDGASMLPMATANESGSVIYLGKVGQGLFPSYQMGFVIAPENFILESENYLQLLDSQGDVIQEQMLTELIEEGEIYRLIKKHKQFYKKRRDVFHQQLQIHFNGLIRYKIPSGGLAFWIEFTPAISLVKLSEEAAKLEVFLPKTILYQDKDTCAIRFGYAAFTEDELIIVVELLKQAYYRTTKTI